MHYTIYNVDVIYICNIIILLYRDVKNNNSKLRAYIGRTSNTDIRMIVVYYVPIYTYLVSYIYIYITMALRVYNFFFPLDVFPGFIAHVRPGFNIHSNCVLWKINPYKAFWGYFSCFPFLFSCNTLSPSFIVSVKKC